ERVRPDTEVVAVDEVQFLDEDIVRAANALADRGVRVILAGTDMDFRGQPFGPMPALLAIAEKVDKLHAICVRCGELATRNQRLVNGRPAPAEGPTIQVGGLESYEARGRGRPEVPSEARAPSPSLDRRGCTRDGCPEGRRCGSRTGGEPRPEPGRRAARRGGRHHRAADVRRRVRDRPGAAR